MTAVQVSGWSRAVFQAARHPQSCPITVNSLCPSAGAMPATSAASSRMLYAPMSSGALLPPYPRWLGTATWTIGSI